MAKATDYKIPSHLEPPGCMREILLSPNNFNECIELALFQEHRFAFFYWIKWTNKLSNIPSLVTYDWHQDLAPPYTDELEGLRNLDTSNKGDVAFYSWAKLSHFNDVQIRAAILLNKIKDVYAICRQNSSRPKVEIIKDFWGNEHKIMIFQNMNDFENHIVHIEDQALYFDIDLDYFTISNPISMNGSSQKGKYTYLSKKEIIALLSLTNPTIQWIFDRLAGMTIATEPEFCGGLKKSNDFLRIIDNLYFTPSLFHNIPNGEGTKWKHLKRS